MSRHRASTALPFFSCRTEGWMHKFLRDERPRPRKSPSSMPYTSRLIVRQESATNLAYRAEEETEFSPVLHESLQLGEGFFDFRYGSGAVDEFAFRSTHLALVLPGGRRLVCRLWARSWDRR